MMMAIKKISTSSTMKLNPRNLAPMPMISKKRLSSLRPTTTKKSTGGTETPTAATSVPRPQTLLSPESPRQAARRAMLKRKFASTIQKAQQQLMKNDPTMIQKEPLQISTLVCYYFITNFYVNFRLIFVFCFT